MAVNRKSPTRRIGRVIAATLAVGIGIALTGAPAFADQPWGRGGYDHYDHDHWGHDRWEHHRGYRAEHWHRGYVYGYAPPPVYYAPPPVYYAPPPPVYYAPPSLSFGVTIPFNH